MERWADDTAAADVLLLPPAPPSYADIAASLARVTSSLSSHMSQGDNGGGGCGSSMSLVSALEQTASIMSSLAQSLHRQHGTLLPLLPPLQSSGDELFAAANTDSSSGSSSANNTFDDDGTVSFLSPMEEQALNMDAYIPTLLPIKDEFDYEIMDAIFTPNDLLLDVEEPSSIEGGSKVAPLPDGAPMSSSVPGTPRKIKHNPNLCYQHIPISPKKRGGYGGRRPQKKKRARGGSDSVDKSLSSSVSYTHTHVHSKPLEKPQATVFGGGPRVTKTKRAGMSIVAPSMPRPPMKPYGILGPTGRLMTLDYWATIVPTDWDTLTGVHVNKV